ncbi:cutinase family protein [Mycolicibacterium mengxianglii]|uniref:cutinase family protein n=1 Tax=Mycolicibacterium mengxianglii TaxID=2736649 RepID=UPI0038CC0503
MLRRLAARRLAVVTSTVAVSGAAFISGAAGTAAAEPMCPDVHWIGAAGSGERGPEASTNAGMGRVMYQSFLDFQQQAAQQGETVTGEAVVYPATEVPLDGGLLDWAGFIESVDEGTQALAGQYTRFVQQCPSSKVVLAGYSQGAMVVHRNLQALDASPNLSAALLIADGDRRPEDPTLNLGSAAATPDTRLGVAQDWPILAHAPAPLPVTVGRRTISVCDYGDAVCDYDPEADDVTPQSVAVHTSYARGSYDWVAPLNQLVAMAPAPATPALADPALPVNPPAPVTGA